MHNSQIVFKKMMFWTAVAVVFCGILFWGVRIILQTDAKFTAAATSTRDIGVFAQRMASYAGRIQKAKNTQVFGVNQQMIRSFTRKLELKHLGLARGNPRLVENNLFADDIKGIYYAMPTNLKNQVRDLVALAKDLGEYSFRDLQKDKSIVVNLKLASGNSFISAVTHVMQVYKDSADARISKAVFILVGALLAIVIMTIVAHIYIFDANSEDPVHASSLQKPDSVSSVLGGLSVFPSKTEVVNDNTQSSFSPDSIVKS